MLLQLDKLIEKTEREYAGTEFPKELTTAQLLLREHEASRNKIRNLIDTTAEEGEEIVIRVRQQVRSLNIILASSFGVCFFASTGACIRGRLNDYPEEVVFRCLKEFDE